MTDPDGVQASLSVNQSTKVATYQDTLGQTALVSTPGSIRSHNGTPDVYTYYDASGNPQTVTVNYSRLYQKTNFGCAGIGEFIWPGYAYFPTSVVLADGETFGLAYESTPGYPNDITGRLAKITLPNGGFISYDYSGPNGMICANIGLGLNLTRTVNDGHGNNSVWTYTSSVNFHGGQWKTSTTTETDPAGNTTTYQFFGGLQTEKIVQDVNLGVLSTTITCYNGYTVGTNQSACVSPSDGNQFYLLNPPIYRTDVYTTLGSSAAASLAETLFDHVGSLSNVGNVLSVKNYGFGATYPPSGTPLTETDTTYANLNGVSCGPISTYIFDHPCSVTTYNSGTQVSQTKYTYNAGGHATQTSSWVSGSTYLNAQASYNSNGTLATSTDPNLAVTSVAYNGSGGCNGLLPTSTTYPAVNGIHLSTSTTWNCFGAVPTSTTDQNGQVTTYGYLDQNGTPDPLWRLRSVSDPLGNVTRISYSTGGSLPATTESAMTFNNGQSGVDVLTTLDGLSRPYLKQTRHSPTSANFDTVVTTYDTMGRIASVSMPCVSTASLTCTAPLTTTIYDAMNRPLQNTDGGGGTVSYTYTNNDVLQVIGPAPTGENTKQKQLEYDGAGRLTSVCEITSATGSGSGACGQANPKTGLLTKYTYGNIRTVVQNAQQGAVGGQQNRSYSYDGLGRLLSETNPEWGPGTTNYTYDSACGTSPASAGDLTKKVDNAGNTTCYAYDALHRKTSITYPSGPYSATTPSKTFLYDATTFSCVNPNGAYVKGQLAEAYTGTSGAKTTDIAFCYSPRGENTDVFESTPNSAGYYHTTASYWANGSVNSVSGVPGLSAWTFTPDGEGRPNAATYGASTNWVTGTTYYPSRPQTNVAFGNGDSDVYSYDSSTGRMNQFQFTVGTAPTILSGSPGWNPNGSLGSLGIADAFNTNNTQNCSYVHDDLGRIKSVNCVNGSTNVWNQSFSLDAFGNISKSGSSAFAAGYQLTNGTTNNREQTVSSCVPTYDANGNLTKDCTFVPSNTYTWDADSNPVNLNGVALTYDALDREVEITSGSTHTQVLYSPIGKLGLMSGQTANTIRVPLPGGSTAELVGSNGGTKRTLHTDWLGSSRFATSYASRVLSYDAAYAPYGENYAGKGTATADLDFTGQFQDTSTGLYDFLYREYNPVQGRWITPDPSGQAAVDPTNPQSWNRYAYVLNNPLATVDPNGLCDQNDLWTHVNGENSQADANPPAPCTYDDVEGLPPSSWPNNPTWTGACSAEYISCTWNPDGSVIGNTGNGQGYLFYVAACDDSASGYCHYHAQITFNSRSIPQFPNAANNGPTATIGPPQEWHPAKQKSALNKYLTEYVPCAVGEGINEFWGDDDKAAATVLANIAPLAARNLQKGGPFVALFFTAAYDFKGALSVRQQCTADVYGGH